MHGSLMMYLFAGPFAFGGLANYIVPLQIGAPDMAFPRLNALSYWLYLSGSITMLMSFFVAGGAAQFGWVAYAPLSSATSSPGAGPDLWIMAPRPHRVLRHLHRRQPVRRRSSTCARPGMTMFRMPIFTWNMLVTGILILIAFPVLTAALIMLFCDRHFGTHIYTAVGCHLVNGAAHGVVRVTAAVAEPLLVLRPSRGLHPRPALLRHRDRDPPRLLPQAGLRLQGHGLRHHGHRRPVHRACGRTTCSPPAPCCCPSSPSSAC